MYTPEANGFSGQLLYLPGNPKAGGHPSDLIKEGGCVDLSMDTLHLKNPLVLFGSEGSAPTLPLFLLLPRIFMLCHCSSTMTKDHFLIIFYGTKRPLCVKVLVVGLIPRPVNYVP